MEEMTGERIRRLREERRWSQKVLGDKLNVSSKTIGNWENDRHVPRSALAALEKVFAESGGSDGDAVERALYASDLVDWRRDLVLSAYRKNLREQADEGRDLGSLLREGTGLLPENRDSPPAEEPPSQAG